VTAFAVIRVTQVETSICLSSSFHTQQLQYQ